jgi:hypothetical protein
MKMLKKGESGQVVVDAKRQQNKNIICFFGVDTDLSFQKKGMDYGASGIP